MALEIRGTLWERWRDWDWNLWDLVSHAWDTILFHIERIGPWGYVIVPLSVWATLILFRPTRYIASQLWIDIYRATLQNVVSGAFRIAGQTLLFLWGQMIARLREGWQWLINLLR